MKNYIQQERDREGSRRKRFHKAGGKCEGKSGQKHEEAKSS